MEAELLIGLTEPETELYMQAIDLRYKELRQPLGLTFTAEQLQEEKDQLTLVASNGTKVVAVLMLKTVSDQVVKVRQVAVDREFQGQKIGQKISTYAEELARNMGFARIELHARKTACDFYKKLGYTVESEEFMEVGIPHFKMKKELI